MGLNTHQLTEALSKELEKECYVYNISQMKEYYDYKKANHVIESFFKRYKLKKH